MLIKKQVGTVRSHASAGSSILLALAFKSETRLSGPDP